MTGTVVMAATPAGTPAAIDLAARALGASVLTASDESFGEKESLLVADAPQAVPGRYGHKGEIVDGWETRRRRSPGHDWAVIRLGAPGVVSAVDVDTTSFTGNFPAHARVEACGVDGYPSPQELADAEWTELVGYAPLGGDRHNVFEVASPLRFSHVRLSIFPDGGVARLRVYGRVRPDPRHFDGLTLDLAAAENGGAVEASSDDFYSPAAVLTMPGPARNMGDGWETLRRRGPGGDWVLLRLAGECRVRLVEVDTTHYKYNASAECELYGWDASAGGGGGAGDGGGPGDGPERGTALLRRTRLQPDTRHQFRVVDPAPVTHVRLAVFPDGGLSRLRLFGELTPAGRRRMAAAWYDALPRAQAIAAVLAACGAGLREAAALVDRRPTAVAGERDRALLRPLLDATAPAGPAGP
jgi:allantoicase